MRPSAGALLLCVCAGAGPALAASPGKDVLRVRYYGLCDVANSSGFAVLANLLDAPRGGMVQFEVEKTWASSPKKNRRDIQITRRYEVPIYAGKTAAEPESTPDDKEVGEKTDKEAKNEADQKGKSVEPDRRLFGTPVLTELAADDAIILVSAQADTDGWELLRADEASLRRVEICFDAKKRTAHAKSSEETLSEDLKDFHLFELAYAALKSRKKLSAERVFSAAIAGRPEVVLRAHLSRIPAKERRPFLRELRKSLLASPEHRPRLLRALMPLFEAELASEMASLWVLLDLSAPAELELAHLAKDRLFAAIEKAKPKDRPALAGPFCRFLVQMYEAQGEPEDLLRFRTWLGSKERALLFAELLASFRSRLRAKEPRIDFGLLELLQGEVKSDPSEAQLEALFVLDPFLAPAFDDQKELLEARAKMATSIALSHPRAADRVVDLVEPLLRHGIEVDPKVVEAYRAATKSAKLRPPKAARITLDPGDVELLASGARLELQKNDLGLELRVRVDPRSIKSYKIEPLGLVYFEGLAKEQLFVIHIQAGKVTVDMWEPQPGREPLPEPKLLDVARAFAQTKGCTTYDDREYRTSEGVLLYRGRDERRRLCTVTIGAYTGRVAGSTP